MKASSFGLVLALVVGGCSVVAGQTDPSSSSESAIRAMTPDEILGEMIYGETLDVDLTPSPKYRAFSFQGRKNDQILAQVVTLDATDPVLWLTDESFDTLSMNNDVRPTDSNAVITGRVLPKTGTYYLVFREMNAAPRAKFAVSLRKLGAIPDDCDPDGEGIVNPECTEPQDVDPFDAASCTGAPLGVAAAATKFASAAGTTTGLRLSSAKIYYRTRQCMVDAAGAPSCSPWVRAFSMDTKLVSIAAAPPETPNTWTITADTARKVKVDFTLEPATAKSYCVDGPFAGLRGEDWSPLTGTPGVCGDKVATTITATCARLEGAPIQLGSGDPSYYTEFGSVLLANY